MADGFGGPGSLLLMAMESMRTSSKASASSIFNNLPLFSSIIAFVLAQSLKVFVTWFRERRWDLKQLITSGGMPSSHAATVTALAAAIGFQDGVGGSLFATAAILACIVMYDASSVKQQAGRQAEVLNQIVYELPAEHPLNERIPLYEFLGHTPTQVFAGALAGLITSNIIHLISVLRIE